MGSTSSQEMTENIDTWDQSIKYVKEAVRNVERFLEKHDGQLKSKAPTFLPSGYVPELDATKELDDEMTSVYHQYIAHGGVAYSCARRGATCVSLVLR